MTNKNEAIKNCILMFNNEDNVQLGDGCNIIMGNMNILVRAECVRCPWLQAETKVATILGN